MHEYLLGRNCSAGTEYVNTKTRTRSPRKKEAGLRLLELVESRGSAAGYPLSGYRPGFTTACNFFRNFIITMKARENCSP